MQSAVRNAGRGAYRDNLLIQVTTAAGKAPSIQTYRKPGSQPWATYRVPQIYSVPGRGGRSREAGHLRERCPCDGHAARHRRAQARHPLRPRAAPRRELPGPRGVLHGCARGGREQLPLRNALVRSKMVGQRCGTRAHQMREGPSRPRLPARQRERARPKFSPWWPGPVARPWRRSPTLPAGSPTASAGSWQTRASAAPRTSRRAGLPGGVTLGRTNRGLIYFGNTASAFRPGVSLPSHRREDEVKL
jgi:hypothetical protein